MRYHGELGVLQHPQPALPESRNFSLIAPGREGVFSRARKRIAEISPPLAIGRGNVHFRV